MRLDYLVGRAHDNSVAKGFWDDMEEILAAMDYAEPLVETALSQMAFAQKIALIHSEIVEAADSVDLSLHPTRWSKHCMLDFVEEIADICIRIFDLAGFQELDLQPHYEHATLLDWGGEVDLELLEVHRWVSKALEADRKDQGLDQVSGALASAIWICKGIVDNLSAHCSLEEMIEYKMGVNEKREYKHGRAY